MIFLTCGVISFAQEKNEENLKTWSFVPMPTLGYNSDLGLSTGALFDFYLYGDGKDYPKYHHKFYLDLNYATKGTKYAHFLYDSEYLIPKHRFTFAATYRLIPMYPFMGFNGAASLYSKDFDLNRETRTAMYNMNLNSIRILSTIQGKIYGKWKWVTGINFWKFDIGDYTSKYYDNKNTLYRLYVDNGLIEKEEANGGCHVEFKGGVSFDSRDFEANPSCGIWFESYFYGSKDIFKHRNDYIKFSTHFRHYIPLIKNRLTFAYHLAYQDLLYGKSPFYMQQEIATIMLKQNSTDGLGGANTVRGVLMNRIVGEGYFWSNVELRLRMFEFKLFKQRFGVGVNPFFDMGRVIRSYREKEMASLANNKPEVAKYILSGTKEKMHMSAGLGLKLDINYNFIISVEFAKPFSKNDGTHGINIGVNYIF